ncbi:MAG TPA: hypothetical protein VG841_12180 [Caulobacterales bacterium]|nr:hypothetical protein [Caulobacterales bacterium]
MRDDRNGAIRGKLRAQADDVRADLDELRKDVGRFANEIGKTAKVQAASAREHLGDLSRSIQSRAQHRVEEVSGRVREHPFTSVGLSLGAGVLIGLALSMRRRVH